MGRIIVISFITIIFVIFVLGFFLFDRNAPTLLNEVPKYWNLASPIMLDFEDENGIKEYKIQATYNKQKIFEASKVLPSNKSKASVKIEPLPLVFKDGDVIDYKISVNDFSNTRFFMGNKSEVLMPIIVDVNAPVVTLLAQSSKITRGGSALIIMLVNDVTLDSVQVSNGKNIFEAFEYEFEDVSLKANEKVFVALIAWPIKNTYFDPYIIAQDKAGNLTKSRIPIHKDLSSPRRISNIKLSDKFLDEKIPEIISKIADERAKNLNTRIEKFMFVNETLRLVDDKLIENVSSNNIASIAFINNHFKAFDPIKNARITGYFADERVYFVNNENISRGYHAGLDLTSVRNATLKASNAGVVAFCEYMPLHGNTLILYHGLGFFSLYAHMKSCDFKVGQTIDEGEIIGQSASTGYSFGDHLHLEFIINGNSVRVNEWRDQKWIDEEINKVFDEAYEKLRAR